MRISLNAAIILILAIAIAAGILLYPARVSCTSILKDCHIKTKELNIEPNIRLGEPGEDPDCNMGLLGSSQGKIMDSQQLDLQRDSEKVTRTARSRYMQLLFFYLRNFTHGPLRY